jgi:hypothetical protein
MSLREAAMILLCHPARSLKQRTDPVPHDLFEKVAANLSVVTNGSAAKPESVRSGAAVVAILAFRPIGFRYRRGLAVIGISTAAAELCRNLGDAVIRRRSALACW